ncbi:DUF1640 domain-containing protein [Vibrio maerlii]|uniref:DUF1640 domain-containing protein n=1 Tax=Vibrio maerlii TaxID=2231648 RepID=UPI000E3E0BFD|nr:DUF1640 domain-containing protein [Vibrio maerlii]
MTQAIKNNMFDSHLFIKKLVESGMPEKQAEVLAEQQIRILDTQIATRADILQVERNLERKLESNTNKILVVIGLAVAFLALFLG